MKDRVPPECKYLSKAEIRETMSTTKHALRVRARREYLAAVKQEESWRENECNEDLEFEFYDLYCLMYLFDDEEIREHKLELIKHDEEYLDPYTYRTTTETFLEFERSHAEYQEQQIELLALKLERRLRGIEDEDEEVFSDIDEELWVENDTIVRYNPELGWDRSDYDSGCEEMNLKPKENASSENEGSDDQENAEQLLAEFFARKRKKEKEREQAQREERRRRRLRGEYYFNLI